MNPVRFLAQPLKTRIFTFCVVLIYSLSDHVSDTHLLYGLCGNISCMVADNRTF